MDIKNRLCIITGANSGIGKATSLALAERGAYLILICRNEHKAEKARNEIIQQTGNSGVEIIIADIGLRYDVLKAVENIQERFDQVDLLINNAGMFPSERKETQEGIEQTFAVNHLGHFILTYLLMDKLKSSDRARIINVASDAHKAGAPFFDPDNLMLNKGYNPMKAYGISKLCNIMFTHELARRTEGSDIQTFSLHPGVVNTNLASEAGWMLKLLYVIGAPFMRSPEKGAETSIYLATADHLSDKNGKYFKNKKISKPAGIAYDDELTEILWDKSKQLADLE